MKKIKKIIKTFIEKKRQLKELSYFLKNGFYRITKNKFERVLFPFCFFVPPFFFVARINTRKKSSVLALEKGQLFNGAIKNVIIADNYVYLFYPNNQFLMDKYIENNYASALTYPKMNILSINVNENYVVAERINGRHINDTQHNFMVFKQLLFNEELIKGIELSVCDDCFVANYVQHGDCHPNNIIWEGDCFKFIDLDEAKPYPAFFDIFYFYCYAYKKMIQELFCDKEMLFLMETFLKKIGAYCSNYFDLYLSLFIKGYCNERLSNRNSHTINRILNNISEMDMESLPLSSKEIKKCYLKMGIGVLN